MGNYNLLKIEDNQFSLHSTEDILSWLEERKNNLEVRLDKISLNECEPWYYDDKGGGYSEYTGNIFSDNRNQTY